MQKYLLLLISCCCINLAAPAQRLYQAPFLSYLGRGLEDHKLTLFNQLPYEGIGKKAMLELYPQLWSQTFTRYALPSGIFIDAFGVLGPKSPSPAPSASKIESTLMLDQFGNHQANVYEHHRLGNFNLYNLLNYQNGRAVDWNRNQLLDYSPSKQFTAYNSAVFNTYHFSTGFSSYLLNNREWGGSTQLDPRKREMSQVLEGFARDVQHWRMNLWANTNQRWGTLELSLHFNQHHQGLDWKSYQYRGVENQQSYLLTYTKYFNRQEVNAHWQYVRDHAEEQLDSILLEPQDEYWRGMVEWKGKIKSKFQFKTRLNVEKHLSQPWILLPAVSGLWGFGKNNRFSLTTFANSGQRQNRPLAFHLDRLRDNYSINWQAKPFEIAHKAGLAFSAGFNHDRFLKLVLDRTWFQDKIITQLDRSNKRLIFRSFSRELRRDALELVLGGKIDPAKKLDAHLMYRWEHWSPDLNMPWQADQAAQLRLRWQIRLSQFDAHYLVRGPQNLMDLSSFPTPEQSPLYHRLDFTYSQRFTHFRRNNHWSKRFILSVHCINLLGRVGEKGHLETGLLLPDVKEPYWSDPQLRNVQISLRQVF